MDVWSWSPRSALARIDANSPHHPPNRDNNRLQAQSKGAAPAFVQDENAVSSESITGKKRKSDALDTDQALCEVHYNDPRLTHPEESPQIVRRKIRAFLESGIMKVGEFQRAIGVSSPAYGRFMAMNGTYKGEGCDTYWKAFAFLKKRELQGLPINKKQANAKGTALTSGAGSGGGDGNAKRKSKTAAGAKKDAAAMLDVSDIHLDGEERRAVPVYDTCDEVRQKIRAILRKEGVTQAALLRSLTSMYPEGTNKVAATSLARFLNHKGAGAGNASVAFYAGYVFFEKLRLKESKPKTQMRLEMEAVHGRAGMDTKHENTGPIWVTANEVATTDKYGRLQFLRR